MDILIQIYKGSELIEEKSIKNINTGDEFTINDFKFIFDGVKLSIQHNDNIQTLDIGGELSFDDFKISVKKDDLDDELDEFTLQFSGNEDEILIDDTVPAQKFDKEEIQDDTVVKEDENADDENTFIPPKLEEDIPEIPEQDKDNDSKDLDEVTVVGFAGGGLLYQLSSIAGPSNGKVFNLEKSELLIGREDDADVVLNDDSVSRRHAVLQRIGIHYYITDLNSSNGTYVNGNKIISRVRLSSNDVIEVGVNTLKYFVINPKLGSAGARISEDATTAGTVIDTGSIGKLNSSKLEKLDTKKIKKKSKKTSYILLLILALFGYYGYTYYQDLQLKEQQRIEAERKRQEELEKQKLLEEQAQQEQENTIACIEDGLCHLPIGVQKQLMAEYKIGIKLLQAERFELAEDRATQILSRAPDWVKAQELRDVAHKEKEKLIAEQKKQEEEYIRKQLEEQKKKALKKAMEFFKNKQYNEARGALGEVFQIDPEDKLAKELSDKMDTIDRIKRERMARQNKINSEYYKDRNLMQKADRYFKKQEFGKAIPAYKKCINIATYNDSRILSIRAHCKARYKESKKLLRELVIPELATADQLLSDGQFLQAIESYKRVLKIDAKNKNAKEGLKLATKSLTAKAKDYYSRGAIAESVSDYSTACLNYNTILEFAIPGSKYYNMALSKVKRYCSGY